MRAEDLRKAEVLHRRGQARAERATRQRDELVWRAIDAGWPYGRIAEAMGLSRGRVGQIALARPEDWEVSSRGWRTY